MARLARVVVPGLPRQITQRGNRRQQTFFCDEDYQYYLELMQQWCSAHQVEIWAYCLMPNHVHLIAVPQSADGLRRAVGEVHRRYTRMVNFREGWRGHLCQGRFASFVLDEPYLLTAARYVELNPVRAGLVDAPSRYPWSSAAAHVRGQDDALVRVAPCSSWRHLGAGSSRGLSGKRTSNSYALTSILADLSATRSFWRRSKKTWAEFSDGKSRDPSHEPKEFPNGERADSSQSHGIRYGVPEPGAAHAPPASAADPQFDRGYLWRFSLRRIVGSLIAYKSLGGPTSNPS